MTTSRLQLDLVDGRFYVDEERFAAYAWMRANEPVYLDERNGVWGVAAFDAVWEASRWPERFSSAGGIRPDYPPLPMMIDMDNPAHSDRRRLVSRGFTPRRVADKRDYLVGVCDELIDAVCEQGHCDFVRDLAAPLPMVVIGDMLGVPPEERGRLLEWSDDMVSSQGANVSPEALAAAADAFTQYCGHAGQVIADRRVRPRDDLFSVLVHAEIDGTRLDDDALLQESLLILIGGDETTRHVLSGGVEQLLRHPEHKHRLLDDPSGIPTAVEEMLRWVSPIKNMCRTVVEDMSWYGADLRAGQKVMLLYESANFDEQHFTEPERFDITRTPNDHLAFGTGAHFCLGNSLARLELAMMVERLLARLPDIELADDGPLPRRPANFVSGLTAMPVRFTPVPRVG